MNYCSQCGEKVQLKVPPGDNRPRHVCDNCGTIHYSNPRMVVGSIPRWQGKVLLCKRAIEPRLGYWTLPAGFMEHNETLEEAAAREAHEEALAKLSIGAFYSAVSVTVAGQVHIWFLADLVDGKFGVGEESLDTKLVAPEDIPWDEISFPSVEFALRRYMEDLEKGEFGVHLTEITRRLRDIYKQPD
ncbi:MAG: NUDIX hydrolase [Pseudomonadota bacterium]